MEIMRARTAVAHCHFGIVAHLLYGRRRQQDEAKRIKEAVVKRVLEFNEEKLFIFI